MSTAQRHPARLAAVLLFTLLTAGCSIADLGGPHGTWAVMICCGDGDLAIGDTMRMQAVAREYFIGDGPEINSLTSPDRYTWTSSNPRVATVDRNGIMHGLSLGYTSITATLHGEHSGHPGSATVMVVPLISKLVMTLSADTILAGDTVRAQMFALDSIGNPVPDAVVRPYSSQGLTVVHAEASILDTPLGAYWHTPASITFRASAPGTYEIDLTRPYMHPGMSYYGVERRVVVR